METIWNWFSKRPKLSALLLTVFVLFLICQEYWPTDDETSFIKNGYDQARINDSIKREQLIAKWGKNYKFRMDSVGKLVQWQLNETKFGKKVAKIKKKHPEWSWEECKSISQRMHWIGMTVEQLYASRGKPDQVKSSNYGNGNEYQLIWYDIEPSYFYTDESRTIKSWN